MDLSNTMIVQKRTVLLVNKQLLGDTLAMTAGVRDFVEQYYHSFDVMVDTNFPEIWENNPYLCKNPKHQPEIIEVGPSIVTNGSKTNGLHITNAFRKCFEVKFNIKIKQRDLWPSIFLSDSEMVPVFDFPYWVINIDSSQKYPSKRWLNKYWQEVIDSLPDITFIQVGRGIDCQYILKGDNVINLIDQTTVRKLFSIVYNSLGVVGLVSSLMHIAGAFRRPGVIVAGNREPLTFEKYSNHLYLQSIGTLPCCWEQACWACSRAGCESKGGRLIEGIPECLYNIKPNDVINSITSFYKGGIMENPKLDIRVKSKKKLCILTNTKHIGGSERSVAAIGNNFVRRGWEVSVISTGDYHSDKVLELFKNFIMEDTWEVGSDVFLYYASDSVFQSDGRVINGIKRLRTNRKVMALTYKLGKLPQASEFYNWDGYVFLCSHMRDQLLALEMTSKDRTFVYPPFVEELDDRFRSLSIPTDKLRIIRHSSQGDMKFSKAFKDELKSLLSIPDAEIYLMPAPTFLNISEFTNEEKKRLHIFKAYEMSVPDFLSQGNLFWYSLPEGFIDQGPRVIVEAAMASRATIADNWGGPIDRYLEFGGWIVENKDYKGLIDRLNLNDIITVGKEARKNFDLLDIPERWYQAITGGL